MDAQAGVQHVAGELWAELEAPAPQLEALQDRGAKHLVARRLVSDSLAVEQRRRDREYPVRDEVCELHALGQAAEEARSVDDVHLRIAERLEQRRIVGGRVLEVAVLHQDDLTRRDLEPGAQRRPLAVVDEALVDADAAGVLGMLI